MILIQDPVLKVFDRCWKVIDLSQKVYDHLLKIYGIKNDENSTRTEPQDM